MSAIEKQQEEEAAGGRQHKLRRHRRHKIARRSLFVNAAAPTAIDL